MTADFPAGPSEKRRDDPGASAIADWWRSSITDIAPNQIRVRGYPIQDLIGTITFPAMVWLMTRGELPSPQQARLLETVLVAGVDHGPLAPSLSIARMAATCGVGLNNAMASGVNVLGDVHGGAGEQCMELLGGIVRDPAFAGDPAQVARAHVEAFQAANGRYLPGFGHRYHKIDPRSVRISALLEEAVSQRIVEGGALEAARKVEAVLATNGRVVPINIDGITAVVLLELGFPAALGRGLFILSRSVGICAHAWEQMQEGGRIKGPVPKEFTYSYQGPALRSVPQGWTARTRRLTAGESNGADQLPDQN
ncbi:MAG: citryl-CoA lyase [Shinella sp. 65-6]|nr:MAG: citryl-CoA lyase [Shinella sp. 65-6]